MNVVLPATHDTASAFLAVPARDNHGLFCSGTDFDITFGLMHTIEKAAQIWILAQSAGQGKFLQTIKDEELRAIAAEFGVQLNAEYL